MTADPTELDWLASDTQEIRRLLDEHPDVLKPLADVTDPNQHAKYLVVAELTWRIWMHAMAVEVLLRQELYTPALVVQRAIFEALTTYGYLVSHENFQDEAVILLAYSFMRDIQHFSHQANLVKEHTAILERMPKHLVEIAKARTKKRPRTWSGKTVKEMAEVAGVSGYDPLYRYMSGEAHASAMGRHIRTAQEGPMMKIHLGRDATEKEIQSSANFARRALHAAFKKMWDIFGGSKITIRSKDPEVWLQEQKG
jgi:hypothetical protein